MSSLCRGLKFHDDDKNESRIGSAKRVKGAKGACWGRILFRVLAKKHLMTFWEQSEGESERPCDSFGQCRNNPIANLGRVWEQPFVNFGVCPAGLATSGVFPSNKMVQGSTVPECFLQAMVHESVSKCWNNPITNLGQVWEHSFVNFGVRPAVLATSGASPLD